MVNTNGKVMVNTNGKWKSFTFEKVNKEGKRWEGKARRFVFRFHFGTFLTRGFVISNLEKYLLARRKIKKEEGRKRENRPREIPGDGRASTLDVAGLWQLPSILFISAGGYITIQRRESASEAAERGLPPLWRFRAKPSAGIPSRKRRRSPIIEGGLMRATMTGHIQPRFCPRAAIPRAAAKCTGRFVNPPRSAFLTPCAPRFLSFDLPLSLRYSVSPRFSL